MIILLTKNDGYVHKKVLKPSFFVNKIKWIMLKSHLLNCSCNHKLFVKGYGDFKENGMECSGSCLADNIKNYR